MLTRRLGCLLLVVSLGSAIGCTPDPRSPAFDQIDATELANHTQILSSDEFDGRGPSSPGEERTVADLQEQFEQIGISRGMMPATSRMSRSSPSPCMDVPRFRYREEARRANTHSAASTSNGPNASWSAPRYGIPTWCS